MKINSTSIQRLLISLSIIIITACASKNVSHSFYYGSDDNEFITLLELEYSGMKRSNKLNKENGLNRIHLGAWTIDELIKIKWRNNQNNQTRSESISIENGLPLSTRNSEIRLTFNKLDEPEIYIFYDGPSPYTYFTFKNRPYVRKRARQIYPFIKELNSENLIDSRH